MPVDAVPGVRVADVAPLDVSTTASAGTSALASRYDHVHDTAAGFIDSSNKFADDVVTLAKMAHGTQGDILYYTAAGAPARLAAGTSGYYLKTQGAGADPVWAKPPGFEKIAEKTVSGAAVTTVSFTGLDLDADKRYLLIFVVTNPTASSSYYDIYFNGDTTRTNYYRQWLGAASTSISAARANDPAIISLGAGKEVFCIVEIMRDPAGIPRFSTNNNIDDTSAVAINLNYGAWITSANVTSIDITAGTANAIGIGSKFILFKVV